MTYEIATTSCLHCLRRANGKPIAGNASYAQVLSFSRRTLITGEFTARSDNDAINLARKFQRAEGRRFYRRGGMAGKRTTQLAECVA